MVSTPYVRSGQRARGGRTLHLVVVGGIGLWGFIGVGLGS
jgi:hypothetical protein